VIHQHVHPITGKRDQLPKAVVEDIAQDYSVPVKNVCTNCGGIIQVMCFRGTGVCSEICRKDRDGDHSKSHAIIEAPVGGERR